MNKLRQKVIKAIKRGHQQNYIQAGNKEGYLGKLKALEGKWPLRLALFSTPHLVVKKKITSRSPQNKPKNGDDHLSWVMAYISSKWLLVSFSTGMKDLHTEFSYIKGYAIHL